MPVVDLRHWLCWPSRREVDVVLWIVKLLVLVIELVIRWRKYLLWSLIMT